MGLTINYTFDSSVTNLNVVGNAAYNPTLYGEYTSAVAAAVNYFDKTITNNISVNINFGWGEVGGLSINPGASGESISNQAGNFTYTDVRNALQATDTTSAVQAAAVASLSVADPTNGTLFNINTAEMKALGLGAPNAPGNDGSVGLNASTNFTWIGQSYTPNSEDAVGTLEHEISEVLGRSAFAGQNGVYTPLDLFRYTAADGLSTDTPNVGLVGARDAPFVGASYNPNAPSYFSYNGHTVTLLYETPADVASGSDVADWAPSVGHDSFGDGPTGAPSPVSATDLQVMNVLGYNMVTCFAEGTRLDSTNGPIAIEAMRVGDLLLTASGQSRPVRWIGRRHLNLMRHPNPRQVRPIRIAAGALGDRQPRRDLLVSPDHAMLLDGLLIPARLLLNGASIRRETGWTTVTYYHVELDAHDILLPEGAPAESYLDTGNRNTFEDANEPLRLVLDMSSAQARRETESCAPFAVDAARVEPIWHHLAKRAASLGHPLPTPIETTPNPALQIEIAGQEFDPMSVEGQRYTFVLPAWQGPLRLRSRHATPSDQHPWIDDQRRLGVMILRMTLFDTTGLRAIPVDHPILRSGWHEAEHDTHMMRRWTDGDAVVEISSDTPCRFDIEVGHTMAYPLDRVAEPTAQKEALVA